MLHMKARRLPGLQASRVARSWVVNLENVLACRHPGNADASHEVENHASPAADPGNDAACSPQQSWQRSTFFIDLLAVNAFTE